MDAQQRVDCPLVGAVVGSDRAIEWGGAAWRARCQRTAQAIRSHPSTPSEASGRQPPAATGSHRPAATRRRPKSHPTHALVDHRPHDERVEGFDRQRAEHLTEGAISGHQWSSVVIRSNQQRAEHLAEGSEGASIYSARRYAKASEATEGLDRQGCAPARRKQRDSQGIRRHQKASEGTRRHQKASEGIRRHQKAPEGIRRHQKASEGLRGTPKDSPSRG